MVTTRNNWYYSKELDSFILFGLSPIVALFLAFLIYLKVPDFMGAIIAGVIIDIPHQAQTHLLLLANPKEFAKFKSHYFISAILIAAFCTFFAVTGNILIPVTVWAYWLIIHIILQHFGIATLYARKGGYSGDTSDIKYLVLIGSMVPIIYRMATTGITFGTPINEIQIVTPAIPIWIPLIMYIVFGILLINFIIKEFRARKESKGYNAIVYSIIAYTLILYNAFFLLESNLILFLLISTALHAIQYHLVAGNRTIAVLNSEDEDYSKIMTFIRGGIKRIVSNKFSWSLSVLFLSTLVFLSNEISYGVIPLTWAMQHFYLDGVIWKKRKEKNYIPSESVLTSPVQG
ncbi:MAG: hypothetical protein RMY29_028465 [Nostoc sp. CreGUA01]|nr:hypothetical protein [Nostoc sp. CreGUA01]